MIMSLALILAASAASPDATPRLAPICAGPGTQQTADPGRAELKRLDRLPPGETYLAVLRTSDGCITPVKASEERARVGGNR